MEQPVFRKELTAKFYVLAGSLFDLSLFDFSNVNIQCFKIDSEKLKEFTQTTHYKDWNGDNRNWEKLQKIKEEFGDRKGDLYVLLPIDLSKEVLSKDYKYCWHVLLLLFPSDLAIYRKISFQLFDDQYLWLHSIEEHTFYPTGERTEDNYLISDITFKEEVNHFIGLFFRRIDSIKFIQIALQSYVNSYSEMHFTMTYLSLCICLESIVAGNTELSFRIKRNVAILCGTNADEADLIFDNLGNIYNLRSKIVHGDIYDEKKVQEYLPYLRNIVSRMIIEVLLINITDLVFLNRRLTFSGFSKKEDLVQDHKEMVLNPISNSIIRYKELKK